MFELPKLPYDFNALEPHIDARTMEIHHGKHHQAYVTNLNAAIQGTDAEGKNILELLSSISKYSPAVRNNGGGHFNHTLFWNIMGPNGGGEPTGNLKAAIDTTFGSFAAFKEEFAKAGATLIGFLSLQNTSTKIVSAVCFLSVIVLCRLLLFILLI